MSAKVNFSPEAGLSNSFVLSFSKVALNSEMPRRVSSNLRISLKESLNKQSGSAIGSRSNQVTKAAERAAFDEVWSAKQAMSALTG